MGLCAEKVLTSKVRVRDMVRRGVCNRVASLLSRLRAFFGHGRDGAGVCYVELYCTRRRRRLLVGEANVDDRSKKTSLALALGCTLGTGLT